MATGFESSIGHFISCDIDQVVGSLASALAESGISNQRSRQIQAWREEVILLQGALRLLVVEKPSLEGEHIILEYEIPRRQKKPDAILLVSGFIVVIEFKIGAEFYDAAAKWQVEDYAYNLRDFHQASAFRTIVPILCTTRATAVAKIFFSPDIVPPIALCNGDSLADTLLLLVRYYKSSSKIDPEAWLSSPYRPSLTIIEAAERLYGNHDVREINHSYAANLIQTTEMLSERIVWAQKNKKRCICFVTGVPGAGKTLTGLNVVHDPKIRKKQGNSGIFLSGNGPLVKIIREALVMHCRRTGGNREQLEHEVSTFIQNIHQFLRYHRENPEAKPHEHVIVFDEAQRAWNREQMLRKQKVNVSEAALLFDVMERLEDWSVIIALVGGGQEIFLGEAGLGEWGRAIKAREKPWIILASPEAITGGTSVAGQTLFGDEPAPNLEIEKNSLAHLSVSVRSHRAQKIATWVNDLLTPDAQAAVQNVPNLREFPLCTTRDLQTARSWLLQRWNEEPLLRCGLVASSEDQRLRAYGLENSAPFRMGFPFAKWFLTGPEDVRSSYRLEVSASEFECQGLELDWVGVCWGGDLTFDTEHIGWNYRKFRGTKWQQCRSQTEQSYIRNRYRVLLTRARAGLVIWVPMGVEKDPTLCPARFQSIFEHLLAAGAKNLDGAID